MKKKVVIATGFFATIILAAGVLLAAASFTGTWSTAWGPLTMTQSDENKVVGNYGGSAPGSLWGVVKGNKLFYNWKGNNGERGRGVFVLSGDGNSFTGTWGSGTSATGGGAWNGKRIK